MTSGLLTALAFVLLLLGFVGCFVPIVPGPLVAYGGLLCLLATAQPPSPGACAAFGALTLAVTALDYVVPAWGARRFRCSRWGTWGCFVGTLAGVFFFPLGLLLGPFCGALAGELLAGKSLGAAAWGGLGALLGFLAGMLVKAAAVAGMAAYVLRRGLGA